MRSKAQPGQSFVTGAWRRREGELPKEYVLRLVGEGESPTYLVRAVRMQFGLELSDVKKLVDTQLPSELRINTDLREVETVTLYRPVGANELKLIEDSGWTAFPPRLPEQPIFYPVTNEAYAAQIARDWNTRFGSKEGFVTRFDVDAAYAAKFERKVVGGREHEELWVPAEELDEFNRHIVGRIEVTQRFSADDRVAADLVAE